MPAGTHNQIEDEDEDEDEDEQQRNVVLVQKRSRGRGRGCNSLNDSSDQLSYLTYLISGWFLAVGGKKFEHHGWKIIQKCRNAWPIFRFGA